MKLSRQWVQHSPDLSRCARSGKPLRAEADCPCGLKMRHQHCYGCGLVLVTGDWDQHGVDIGRIIIRRGKMAFEPVRGDN